MEHFSKQYSFDDPPFRLKFYCKKMFEDFFNNEEGSLPYNFQLSEYEFDDMFPYDNNIINIKMINNEEIINGSINCYENNSQFITRMAILIMTNASENLIGNEEFNNINDEINSLFKKKNKSINTLLNDSIFELTGNLHFNLVKELKELLSKKGEREFGIFAPDINSSNFLNNNNDINKYNQRTLGIFLYALKIALTTFIFDKREKYFYSYLVATENTSKIIIDILDNSLIPGYDLYTKGLQNQGSNYESIYIGISELTLRFILFSNLFFNILTKKLNAEDLKKYSIENKYNKGNKYSCMQMLFYIWNILETKLKKKDIPTIEIYFNLINKYLPYILKKCTLETVKTRKDTEIFVEKFEKFIQACIGNYKEYSLNFIDLNMRYIIQELNNPLKYDFDKFPFLEYYTVQSKPNEEDIINKIERNEKYLILNSIDKIKNPAIMEETFSKIFPLFNFGKYFANSINGDLTFIIKEIEKYSDLFKLFNLQFEEKFQMNMKIRLNEDINKLYKLEEHVDNKIINESNEKISKLINDKIKYEPSYKYLFNEIYEEKEFKDLFENQCMNLNLSQISKYKFYPVLISDYIYRNNFKSDLKVDYFQYKNFSINCEELDEYLFSLLLFNKKIFLNLENSKKFFIPKFDNFNKTSNNQLFLSNYLNEYPSREELSKEQIEKINESFKIIIENKNSKILSDKNKFEDDLKEKNNNLQKEIDEKRNLINNLDKDNNINNDEIDFSKYEKYLEIKKLEEEIEQNEYIIDILNYQYNQIISSSKVNYIIDVCFGLQNLLQYIYDLNIGENIPLNYICNNLPLFCCEKDKLVCLFEQNTELNLSNLFPLYEYFELLVFAEFIYHINKGYMAPLPLYISKKILYIFEKDEIKNNIIFTKTELIEAIRKCLSRYIVSSIIKDDFYVEDLNSDLFELLFKEDLWRKDIEMKKLKESFTYINNFIKFKIKTKHIFNLFEILVEIPNKEYLSLDNFKEEEKNKEDKNILKISEMKEENEDKEKKEEEIKVKNNDEDGNEDLDKSIDSFYEKDKAYILIKNRKKFIFEQLEKSKLIQKYIDITIKDEKNKNKVNINSNLLKEIIKYGSIFYKEKLIPKFNKFIKEPKINIKFSYLKEKKDILQVDNEIQDIILFNKNKIIVLYNYNKFEMYLFDKKTFREKTTFIKLEIDNLDNINNINKVNCIKESIEGFLLIGTTNGHILKIKADERKKSNKTIYILQVMNEIKLEDKKKIYSLLEISTNTLISKDEYDITIWQNNIIKKKLGKGDMFKINNYLIVAHSSLTFYDIKKNFEEISKIDKKYINITILNEKIMIGEDNNEYTFHILDIDKRKDIKEKKYEPQESFILKKICKKWTFRLNKDNKSKLIKIDLINDNNNYDLICNNKEYIIMDSSDYMTNLFDEFFITCNKGKISCYGYF